MNDRPLTYVTSEAADPEPLTPAQLLYGRRITTLPYNDKLPEPKPFTHDTVTKQARVQTSVVNHLRDKWRHKYLTSLSQYHKTTGQNDQSIKVGDVVLIHDETHRTKWKMGTIEKLMTGRDDLTLSALVRTGNGQSTTRPIAKLYPLETATYSSPGGCRADVGGNKEHDVGWNDETLAGEINRR